MNRYGQPVSDIVTSSRQPFRRIVRTQDNSPLIPAPDASSPFHHFRPGVAIASLLYGETMAMIIVSPRINVQNFRALPGENRGCRLARVREYAFRIRIIIFNNNAGE